MIVLESENIQCNVKNREPSAIDEGNQRSSLSRLSGERAFVPVSFGFKGTEAEAQDTGVRVPNSRSARIAKNIPILL